MPSCVCACVWVCVRLHTSICLFLSGLPYLHVSGLVFGWLSLCVCVCVCVCVCMYIGDLQVCVTLCACRNGVGLDTGRQRDALLRSHYVRQGCGNAVLGNIHVTCVPGRWLTTHEWYVPVSSTRHHGGAIPISCQHRGALSGQRNSH